MSPKKNPAPTSCLSPPQTLLSSHQSLGRPTVNLSLHLSSPPTQHIPPTHHHSPDAPSIPQSHPPPSITHQIAQQHVHMKDIPQPSPFLGLLASYQPAAAVPAGCGQDSIECRQAVTPVRPLLTCGEAHTHSHEPHMSFCEQPAKSLHQRHDQSQHRLPQQHHQSMQHEVQQRHQQHPQSLQQQVQPVTNTSLPAEPQVRHAADSAAAVAAATPCNCLSSGATPCCCGFSSHEPDTFRHISPHTTDSMQAHHLTPDTAEKHHIRPHNLRTPPPIFWSRDPCVSAEQQQTQHNLGARTGITGPVAASATAAVPQHTPLRSTQRDEPQLTPGSTGFAPRSLSTRRARSDFHSLVWAEEFEGTLVKSENLRRRDSPRCHQHGGCDDGHVGNGDLRFLSPSPRSSRLGACPVPSIADTEDGQASGGGREQGGRARKQSARMGRTAGSSFGEDDGDWAVLEDSEGEEADEGLQVRREKMCSYRRGIGCGLECHLSVGEEMGCRCWAFGCSVADQIVGYVS